MSSETRPNQLEECYQYFKENRILQRLMEGFREKYLSFGAAGGNVVLTGISGAEIEILEGLLEQSFHGKKSVSISAVKLQKALDSSRFAGVSLEELLERYFHGNLKSKKEIRQEEYEERMAMFRQAAEEMPGTLGAAWVADISEEHSTAGQIINRRFKTDRKAARELLKFTATALNNLPVYQGRVEYLAVFSAVITGNPHYFDEGNEANALLRCGVEYALKQDQEGWDDPVFPAFAKQKQLLIAGILKDDISNYTMAYGIHAWDKAGNLHEGVEGFWRCQESMHLSLATVAGLGKAACAEGVIYVFENPSVYSVLAAKQGGRKSFLCMNGQPNMAAILLLDCLAKSQSVIYYAGDFDPEGLWIAQRLKLRYSDQLHFLAMDREHYKKVMSSVVIEERRLKVLARLTDRELLAVAQCMKETGRAGYQEGLIDDYWEKIEQNKRSLK